MTAGPETPTVKIVPLPGKTVGHIGLGAMGRPIAQNFVAGGQPTVVFDADPTSQERFLDDHSGIRGAASLADFADCEVVVLVLPTSDIVDAVVLSDEGLLTHLRPGSTIIDMGSSIPTRTQALAEAAAAKGISVVDAPVSGGVARARQAALAVMVGGDAAAVDSVVPLLKATGSDIIHVGPVGSGHAAKALNNLMAANNVLIAAEALLVGRKFGIDPATLLSVLNASSGRNQATETKFEKFVLSRSFDSGFAARLMRKDIGIALDLAHDQEISPLLGETVGRLWNAAVDELDPAADQTDVVRYLEELHHVSLEDPAGH
ncbi:NAD(P)-dependent oxidoreductase [Rhodococcus artemisiae]|uniref:NAD(P)-dependent oxidoreductase n=1 Tax=Rhodococcus artemisiae TaxID=714159 RepID=A0ABU7L5S2_9NOCA|nr:NAD(P)-dependent oxidoreductase [Rhodococcus artemisiae]MEE2056889.1 NAD(P)-dependent oxidoreductase [Rhodococcus artemisiae]